MIMDGSLTAERKTGLAHGDVPQQLDQDSAEHCAEVTSANLISLFLFRNFKAFFYYIL